MRTNVVLPVWVPPPEVRPAAGLLDLRSLFNNVNAMSCMQLSRSGSIY